MTDTITIRAVYEDGVFKPLTPLDLADKQQVELQIALRSEQQNIVKLGGIWSRYVTGEGISFGEIEELTSEAHAQSLNRLLKDLADEEAGDKGDV